MFEIFVRDWAIFVVVGQAKVGTPGSATGFACCVIVEALEDLIEAVFML
jgi:hypothetical protein